VQVFLENLFQALVGLLFSMLEALVAKKMQDLLKENQTTIYKPSLVDATLCFFPSPI
jgi:hypothetical protein